MKNVSENVYALAKESVAIHIARLDSRMDGLEKEYRAIAKQYPKDHPCRVHLEEAKAVRTICRGLVELLLGPESEGDSAPPVLP